MNNALITPNMIPVCHNRAQYLLPMEEQIGQPCNDSRLGYKMECDLSNLRKEGS